MNRVENPLAELKRLCELPDVRQRKLGAARCYRDHLSWAVHPLRGPTDKRKGETARGKAPLHENWPEHTVANVTDAYLEEHFGNGYDANLGIVVRQPHVCVDLDSKADKGESVRAWLGKHPELAHVPRERTGGGAHLHFRCPDLPAITKDGKPYNQRLVSKLDDHTTAEFFFDGLNIVVSPSRHASGALYSWEVVGEIPEVKWEQLKEWFGFRLPDDAEPQAERTKERKAKKSSEWLQKYKGDLRTLDLAKLFGSIARLGENLGDGRFAVRCPWHEEHSHGGEAWEERDSSTVIFTAQGESQFPGFLCRHAHCDGRGLEAVLEWFEKQTAGIVDRHCARQWVYQVGQTSTDGRRRVVLPGDDRPESEFAAEAGKILGPKNVWFRKLDEVVEVRLQTFSEKVKHLLFCRMEPAEARTAIETYIETGVLRGSKADKKHFIAKSMDMTMARTLLSSAQFKKQLPEVVRILDVQIPIRFQDKIVRPRKGYDQRFQSYL